MVATLVDDGDAESQLGIQVAVKKLRFSPEMGMEMFLKVRLVVFSSAESLMNDSVGIRQRVAHLGQIISSTHHKNHRICGRH